MFNITSMRKLQNLKKNILRIVKKIISQIENAPTNIYLWVFSFSAIIIGDFIGSLIGGFLPHILSKSEAIRMKYTLLTGVIILFTSSIFLYQINEKWQRAK